MAIDRWEPLQELTPLREAVSRLLEDSFVGLKRFDGFGHVLPMDIRELDGEYVIEASLPGFKPEDVQITASGDTVTIRAERKEEKKEKEGGTYVRHERYEGTLYRSVTLPHTQADGVQATYQHGVLTLHVPKAPQAKATTIPVKALPEGSSH
jgi:HSP20 family protein